MGLFKVNRVKLLQPEEFLSDTISSRLCCPSSGSRDKGTKVDEIFLWFIISSDNNSPVVFKQEGEGLIFQTLYADVQYHPGS